MDRRIAVVTLAVLIVLAGLAFGWARGAPLAAGVRWSGAAAAAPASPPTPACDLPWATVDSPNPSYHTNRLFGIAAVAPADAWAVGTYDDNQNPGGSLLTLHWNGTYWTLMPSPPIFGLLTGVAGLASDDVWAVGDAGGPLIVHWDGTAWNISYRQQIRAVLRRVVAVAADDVWAVGNVYSVPQATLIMHWDGTTWSVVPSPNAGLYDNELWDVAAASPHDVWAVGYFLADATTTTFDTLIEHWDGQQWQVIPSPNPPGSNQNLLYSISATDSANAWAVGVVTNRPVGAQLLTEHWDGRQWTQVPGPSELDTAIGTLYQVVTHAPQEAWAVGYYFLPGQYPDQTLILHWDGARWTRVPSPSPGALDNQLEGLAVLPSGEAWTVGYLFNEYYVWLTLVEHLASPCTPSTPTPLTPLPTATARPTRTPRPTPTAPPCGIMFSDVQPTDYFYGPVEYLVCRGVVSGYADGTFRPANSTTRGQLSKLVANGFGWPIQTPATPTFADVPASHPFYAFVETAAAHGVISGYACGGAGEPCPGRYFRPAANVTRGQLAKILGAAKGWPPATPPVPTFADVPASSPFYGYIERAYTQGVLSGYTCGSLGEACPGLYFRPAAASTRGQFSKILYNVLVAP